MDIITLLQDYASELLSAELDFTEHPDKFSDFEHRVASASQKTAADFLAMALTQMNQEICDSGLRRKDYNILKHDQRTIITTVGDVTYRHTLFSRKEDGARCYLLDDMMHWPANEKFSEQAEAKVLYEAEAHSYQHAADALQIGAQKISKVTVMNKVHGIAEELPPDREVDDNSKKSCKYLYIEADEDHIHLQKNTNGKTGVIGKLVYLFEGKEDVCTGKRKLISLHYLGGLYPGSDANASLWKSVQKYIEDHYNTDEIKTVYISGDGGSWIKAGTEYVDRSVFVADKFHLMKYISKAARYTLDEEANTKEEFYRHIREDDLKAALKLLTAIRECNEESEGAVEDYSKFFVNNWDAIQRAFNDSNVLGCSAESHVSNVYSDRMSSRPMGWSEVGSDHMCRLRCYVRNYGAEKIVDLVQYRREKAFEKREVLATGTDGIIEPAKPKKRYSKAQKEVQKYFEAMQATIGGYTVRKTLAIRQRINEI